MARTLRGIALVALVAAGFGPAPGPSDPTGPAWYQRRDTWQETMRASREALRARQREEEARDPGARPFISDVMRGGDPPRRVEVSVAGWQDLFLIVTDDGDYHDDVANWAEARLVAPDGRIVYLDTVEPVSATQEWGSFRRDNRSAVGGPLTIAQQPFERGLGTHAKSVIRYHLGGRYARFEAWVGVDVSRGTLGSVRFVVASTETAAASLAAGKDLWDRIAADFTSPRERQEIAWEQEDRIWENDWGSLAELAARYARATRGAAAARAWELARGAASLSALDAVRRLYHRSRLVESAAGQLKSFGFRSLRLAIQDMGRTFGARYPRGQEYLKQLARLEAEAVALTARPSPDEDRVLETWRRLSALSQEALLANPLLRFDRLLLVKRGVAQMGLPANWQSNSSLPKFGYDNEIAVLSPVAPGGKLTTLYRPDRGRFVGDVDLHFDGDRLLFSSIGSHDRWRVFEIRADGSGLRQVSQADPPDVDCYDACYLPDGRIVFNSTACFVGVPCVFGSDHVTNLYVMGADGGHVRQLCNDQDHDWCPTVLNNGRVMYLRWEYADTPHSQTRLLFHMNPDGTEQMEYYGSNSYWPNGVFYARPVPGHPTKVVGIVTGHHGVPRMGELVIFDPRRGQREASGVVQRIPGWGRKVEPVVADALVDGSWPKFLHPYPLSEKYLLVSAQPTPTSLWGIYLVDVFDNMTLLAEMPGYALLEPIPLRPTPRPPVIADRVDLKRKDAVVFLSDVYRGDGLKGVPRGTVKKLRVFAYHWAYQNMGGLLGVIGMDGPWDIKRVLGTVPVEPDGSARFYVPAYTPISVQPLDAEGKALQLMRSWMTAMPGEVLSCVGCHERQGSAPPNGRAMALARPPSQITPWYGPTRGFSYPREVQPVLDRYCVSCHNGSPAPGREEIPDLRGNVRLSGFSMVTPGNGGGYSGRFSVGYANLHRYVRRPGIESDYHLLAPKEFHADTTELVQLLMKGHHGVRLDAESWDRLITWIDLNAPYHGTWHEEIADPGPQRARRRELRLLYTGLDDDPEAIPEVAPLRQARAATAGVRMTPMPSPRPEATGTAQHAGLQSARAAPARTRTVDLGGGVKLDMVLVPAGEFAMGDPEGLADERPVSRVRIARPFWMGRCEVTNAQFARFDPAHDSGREDKLAYQFGVRGYPVNAPGQPVVRVSWQQAMAFCRWLSTRTGLRFSLPTEAQWEYACRAGGTTPLFYGGVDDDFAPFANLADAKLREFASNPYTVYEPLSDATPYDDYIPKDTRFNDGGLVTVPVGSYRPNAWGLYDMHGNAAEWTRTTYRPYPYDPTDGRDSGETTGRKVVRGGSWRDRPKTARSAYRLSYPTYHGVYNVGLRVVCEAGAEVARAGGVLPRVGSGGMRPGRGRGRRS